MRSKSSSAVFELKLQADGDASAAIHGLRWLLKTALRRYGLRAVSVAEVREGETDILVEEDAV